MKSVAINGFGRIGRCVLRAWVERRHEFSFSISAINEPADLETISYLCRYDSTHGRFPARITHSPGQLLVDEHAVAVTHHGVIDDQLWHRQSIDLVLECSGLYGSRSEALQHVHAGADKVLLSQPGSADLDYTVVYGINHAGLRADHQLVSNASCTTNCIVPVIATLQRSFGVAAGHITTLHSMMNDQPVLDAYHHTDLRKTRSASQSMIPVDTELARGIERVLPGMGTLFSASAIRVPTHNVSAMELVVQLDCEANAEQINAALSDASEQQLKGVLGVSTEPLASCDFNHDQRSAIVDAGQTRVIGGRLAKMLTWFDNEWGYANRMLEVCEQWIQ